MLLNLFLLMLLGKKIVPLYDWKIHALHKLHVALHAQL